MPANARQKKTTIRRGSRRRGARSRVYAGKGVNHFASRHMSAEVWEEQQYERRLFRFLSEQHAAKVGQLARAFGIYRADMERIVVGFAAEGLVVAKRFLTGDDVWVWLAPLGDKRAATGFRSYEPHYRNLAHWGAITDARIYVEGNLGTVEWLSERQLRREQGGNPKGYLPDAIVVHHVEGRAPLRYAIEVELSGKTPQEWEDKIASNEESHDLVIYFATPSICRKFKTLGLAARHPRLRVYEIPAVPRALGQPAWRIPGNGESPPDRAPSALSKLELDVIDLIVQQGQVPVDQLEAFFELEAEEITYIASRLVAMGALNRAKPLVEEPPWLWATQLGANLSRLDLGPAKPHLSGLERARAANEIRLRLTKGREGMKWVSGRELHRLSNIGKPPAGAIAVGSELHAVDILLFVADADTLQDRMSRRFEEGYNAILWFYSKKSSAIVKKFWKQLPHRYQERLRILPIPAADHLHLAPGRTQKRSRAEVAAVPFSSPNLWSRLAARPPARLRRIEIDEVWPDSLETIAKVVGIDRVPVVTEAWTELEARDVRWLVTDVGFFRVSHSAWGPKADEVEREDVFVKEEGPPIVPPPRRGSRARRRPPPEKYEMDDRVWESVGALVPPTQVAGRPDGRRRKTLIDDRAILSGAIWMLRHGADWTDVPPSLRYGAGGTIRKRLRHWQEEGLWGSLRQQLEVELPDGRKLEWSRLEPSPRRRRRRAAPQSFEMSDEIWESIEPILDAVEDMREEGQRCALDDRAALSGVLWRLRHRVGWQGISASLGFGDGRFARAHLREWEALGVWNDIRELLEAELPDGEDLEWARLQPAGASKRGRFNRRQQAWLARMAKEPQLQFSYGDYQRLMGARGGSARSDLGALADEWLVIGRYVQGKVVFSVPSDLQARLRVLEDG